MISQALAVGGSVRVLETRQTADGMRARVSLAPPAADRALTPSPSPRHAYSYASPRAPLNRLPGAPLSDPWHVFNEAADMTLSTQATHPPGGPPLPFRPRSRADSPTGGRAPDESPTDGVVSGAGIPAGDRSGFGGGGGAVGGDAVGDGGGGVWSGGWTGAFWSRHGAPASEAHGASPTDPSDGRMPHELPSPAYGWVTASKAGRLFLVPPHTPLDAGERQRHMTLYGRRRAADNTLSAFEKQAAKGSGHGALHAANTELVAMQHRLSQVRLPH